MTATPCLHMCHLMGGASGRTNKDSGTAVVNTSTSAFPNKSKSEPPERGVASTPPAEDCPQTLAHHPCSPHPEHEGSREQQALWGPNSQAFCNSALSVDVSHHGLVVSPHQHVCPLRTAWSLRGFMCRVSDALGLTSADIFAWPCIDFFEVNVNTSVSLHSVGMFPF